MHPELKRLASNVSQWPAGYKWVRSDSSVQMMTMSRNDYAPDNDHHWFSYQEWYQARRTLDFPLPSGRVEMPPVSPPAAPDFQKNGVHPNLERIAREVSDWDDSFNFLYVDAEHGNIMRTLFPSSDHFLYDKKTWEAAREYLVSTGKMSLKPAAPVSSPSSSPLGAYQWGFEYTVKGVKPGIADDVRVSYICEDGLTGECELSKLGWNTDCKMVETIRIIDPRYKPSARTIEVGKQCIYREELVWIIGVNHFHPGNYFVALNEGQSQPAVSQVSGEQLEPVTKELMTLIELTNSVVISKKIIEAGYKRG